jgi:photosystem II stability/assembly factor-like uncharacterized protein
VDTYFEGLSTVRVIAVGTNSLLRTFDGSTWTTGSLPGGTTYEGVFAKRDGGPNYSGGTVIVVGWGGSILKSTNDGTTWTSKSSGTAGALHRVINVPGTDTWYASGDSGLLIKSTDDGETWSPLITGAQQSITGLAVSSAAGPNQLWASGTYATMLHSTTGGL